MNYIFLQAPTKPSPIDVYENLIKNFQSTDLLWMIIIGVLTYGLYAFSLVNLRKQTADWRDVTFHLFLIMGLVVAFFTFGKYDVDAKYPWGYIIMGGSFLFSLTALVLYANHIKSSTKIINSMIIGLLGFGMFYSVVIKELGFFYAVLFGFLGGLVVGRTIQAIKVLQPIAEKVSKDDKWDKEKEKGQK